MSYALQVEQLDRLVSTERVARAMEGESFPTLLEAREAFDALLLEPFQTVRAVDPEKAELMEALGLRRVG